MINVNTTLSQLTHTYRGAGPLRAMIGAHSFLTSDNSISFKFKGCRRASYCKIELTPDDLYKVTFCRIRNFEPVDVQVIDRVSASNLKQVFESKTGLFLSL